jgi:hypothetical protein
MAVSSAGSDVHYIESGQLSTKNRGTAIQAPSGQPPTVLKRSVVVDRLPRRAFSDDALKMETFEYQRSVDAALIDRRYDVGDPRSTPETQRTAMRQPGASWKNNLQDESYGDLQDYSI